MRRRPGVIVVQCVFLFVCYPRRAWAATGIVVCWFVESGSAHLDARVLCVHIALINLT